MYFIINTDIKGKQAHFGAFSSKSKAKKQLAKMSLKNGAIVTSDLDPTQVLFEKQEDGSWLDLEREWTIEDTEELYAPMVERGNEIVKTIFSNRVGKFRNGEITEEDAIKVDVETDRIQVKLKEGNLKTAKYMLEQLPDSSHKTEFLGLINTAISELY